MKSVLLIGLGRFGRHIAKTLDELGVSQRLKEMGIKDGDSVTIAGWELEWED